jgi:hypothetical protein
MRFTVCNLGTWWSCLSDVGIIPVWKGLVSCERSVFILRTNKKVLNETIEPVAMCLTEKCLLEETGTDAPCCQGPHHTGSVDLGAKGVHRLPRTSPDFPGPMSVTAALPSMADDE